MLVEAEAAQEVIDRSHSEPKGTIRLSCPPGMIYFLIAPLVVRFMQKYPEVKRNLDGPDGASVQIHHQPRLVTDDVFALRQAALGGLGILKMPLIVGGRDLVEGRFVSVLPDWRPRGGIFHAVFPSRRGLMPAVRAFLDFISESMDEVDFRLPEEQS